MERGGERFPYVSEDVWTAIDKALIHDQPSAPPIAIASKDGAGAVGDRLCGIGNVFVELRCGGVRSLEG